LLYDRQHARGTSQAALLLVPSTSPDAEDIVRQGLRQTDAVEVFLALAAAVHLSRDPRFRDEFLHALTSSQALVRQAAARALAETADARVVLRLQALVEDPKVDSAVRQAALWSLGHSGRKSAVLVLLDQLSNDDEALRQHAAAALEALTGLSYGTAVARSPSWWQRPHAPS